MTGRFAFFRPGYLPATLLVAIATLLFGCERTTPPGPLPQAGKTSDAPARSPTAESAEEATAAAASARATGAAEVSTDSSADVPSLSPLRDLKVTEFEPSADDEAGDADAVAGSVVINGDDAEEADEVEMPSREDLAEDDTAVAIANPAFAEPPNPTVEIDVLQVPTEGLVRMHPQYNVWVNRDTKQIVMSAEVCRREGALEMFACLKQTKEHESILSVYTEALIVHATLQALGVQPGRPVEFQPRYRPAEGREIEITVFWRDDAGKIREARGQDWVRDIRTKKTLTHPWVFAGSGFWENETTKEKQYLAEYGDFICVANFNSAMIDLPIESNQAEAGLLFEPFTERIPPLGSRVTLVLTPGPETQPAEGSAATGIERHDL